jgi:Ni,Fe-hydrogenase I cytochrome b subunit
LLLCRVAIEWTQPGEEKLKTKIKRMAGLSVASAEDQYERKHYLLVKRGYAIFYLMFLVMGLTGLGLAYEHTPWLEGIQDPIKKIHTVTQYLIYTYILVHLIGVIRADAGKYPGLVSGMIHGSKRN